MPQEDQQYLPASQFLEGEKLPFGPGQGEVGGRTAFEDRLNARRVSAHTPLVIKSVISMSQNLQLIAV